MHQYGTLGLCSHDQYNTEQVGGETRPWMIVNGENGAVYEFLYLVGFLRWNVDVVPVDLHINTKPLKRLGYNAQVWYICILNGQLTLCHSRKANEGTYFDHICQQSVFVAF